MEKELKEKVRQWLIKAQNDIKSAHYLFKADELISDSICFHCQQAAEKYLKAYLVSKGIEPEKTHKIERLIEACKIFDSSFFRLKEAVLLTEYAVEFRYPDDNETPSIEEAKEALAQAEKVKNFILKILDEIRDDKDSLPFQS